jgi:aminoglycoside 2''-phosphotransferase
MHERIARYEPRIRELRPDLTLHSITYHGEGLVNEVLVVNGEIAFRFTRNENGQQALQQEAQILARIRPHLRLQVPAPFHVGREVMAYPLVNGETLSRELLLGLSEIERQAAADQLAEFLRVLHGLPTDASIPITSAPVRHQDWTRIRAQVESKVYPLLMAHQIEWARQLFDGALGDPHTFEYQPCLVHGDLGPYHILFDRAARRINGIIDFGVAGLGDPAMDLGNLLQVYGESFVGCMQTLYPESRRLMKRARFYAQALELEWALSGLTSGEAFWFLAHLGGARDLQF